MTVYEHVTITGSRDRNWIVDAQEDSVDPSCSGFVSSAEGLAEESGDLVLGTLVSPFPCSSGLSAAFTAWTPSPRLPLHSRGGTLGGAACRRELVAGGTGPEIKPLSVDRHSVYCEFVKETSTQRLASELQGGVTYQKLPRFPRRLNQ